MKSLATLIKLQKTKVDEQRLLLAKLQEQLAAVIAQIKDIVDQQAAQRALIMQEPSMALTYESYLQNSLKQLKLLEKRKVTMEYAVNVALDKMAELFEEQKRYELAERNRLEEEEAEEQRKETHFLDEVGSIGFVRKKQRK